MPDHRRIHFPPFALDLVNECLWRGPEAIKLRPKAFAVLEHLVGRPGQLVTKESLIGAVWQDTFVGDAVLKVAIRQLREALADNPKSPRFIETAHRRGYRFIGRIESAPAAPPRTGPVLPRVSGALPAHNPGVPPAFVGRDQALSQLQLALEGARHGQRHVVFVTGEAGIGKTTLLDAFVAGIATDPDVRSATGQCLEQYGAGEPYLPILEAVSRLCRRDPGAIEVLRVHAPMWLLQMPSVARSSDSGTAAGAAFGATRERMLREMSDALDALTAHTPLLLVLEDLHWSDHSTLDLMSYVARRRGASHLMIAGTYRPADLIITGHPLKGLKQELLAKQLCEELALDYLTTGAVAEYLDARFPRHRFPPALAALIHDRTEGNPLFMVNTVDYLVDEGHLEPVDGGWRMAAGLDRIKVGVPDSVRHLIETQIDRLDALDRRVLETASVAGAEFSTPAVAAGLDERLDLVEARCEDLSRRHQFLRDCGVVTLPDGGAAGRYGFVHAVYRHVLYERIATARRVLLHQRIAERGEALYGHRAGEIAAELAMHFEQARQPEQAARHLQQAAHNAMRRSAYGEAVALARHGLKLLEPVPDTDGRARQELWLCITLGVPLIAMEGYAAPAVGEVYRNARALCQRLGDTPEISHVLWGLWTYHILRADLSTALDLATEFVKLADRLEYPGMAMRGHWAMEVTCTHQGEFAAAVDQFEKALTLYHPERHRDDGYYYAMNPGVALRCFAAWSLWFVGRPARALGCLRDAVALARELSEPPGLAHALVFGAILHQLRLERDSAREYAEAALALSNEHDLAFYGAMARVVSGWTRIGSGNAAGAIAEIREGLDGWAGTGARLMRPHFLALLSDALDSAAGDDEGRRVLDEALALAEETGERSYEAELHRLKGERLARGGQSRVETEACFTRALEIARRQGARSLEVRVRVSLARFHLTNGDSEHAREILQPVCETSEFADTADTVDGRSALSLLNDARRRC